MLPPNTARVLMTAGYLINDFVVTQCGDDIKLDWLSKEVECPTEETITNWAADKEPLPSGQLFTAAMEADRLAKLDRESEKITLRSSIAADIQAIDDYFALPTPNNAQHFAQMRHVSRCMRRVLRFIGRELLS